MMKKKNQTRSLVIIYFIVIAAELVGEAAVELLDSPNLVFATKPLMMPLLMLFFIRSIQPARISGFQKIILGALFFSWLGDLFLMVTWTGQNLFIYGLSAFLIAHVLYIFGFRRIPEDGKSFLRKCPYAVLPIILYTTGLIYSLIVYGNSEFTEMRIPVIVYAGVIMIMVISALNRKDRVIDRSFEFVFFGSHSIHAFRFTDRRE